MVQWEPENSGIERRLLNSIYDYKQSNEHVPQQLCSINILLNKIVITSSKAKYFVTTSNELQYCYNVVFLF